MKKEEDDDLNGSKGSSEGVHQETDIEAGEGRSPMSEDSTENLMNSASWTANGLHALQQKDEDDASLQEGEGTDQVNDDVTEKATLSSEEVRLYKAVDPNEEDNLASAAPSLPSAAAAAAAMPPTAATAPPENHSEQLPTNVLPSDDLLLDEQGQVWEQWWLDKQPMPLPLPLPPPGRHTPSTRPESLPGAYATVSPGYFSTSGNTGRETPATTRTSNQNTTRTMVSSHDRTIRSTEDLVEATQVPDTDQLVMGQATPAPESTTTAFAEPIARQTKCLVFVVIVVTGVVCLAIGVVLGVVLAPHSGTETIVFKGNNPNNGEHQNRPTMAPSTFVITKPLQLLHDSLPSATQTSLRKNDSPQSYAFQWVEGHPDITDMPEWRKQQLFALVTTFFALQGPRLWRAEIANDWLQKDKHECFWFSAEFGVFEPNDEGGGKGKPEKSTTNVNSQKKDIYREYFVEQDRRDPCNDEGKYTILSLITLGLKEDLLMGLSSNNSSNAALYVGPPPASPFLPPEVALLTSLTKIGLSLSNLNTSLTEFMQPSVFEELAAKTTELQDLDLNRNILRGTMMTEIGLLSSLRFLGLADNALSGSLPMEALVAMTRLTSLDLSRNSAIEGSIATEIGKLAHLENIDVQGLSLSGRIPTELGLMPKLTHLGLSDNLKLSGPIPTELGHSSSNLTDLLLVSMNLTGPIPSELGLLSSLALLELQGNNLEGAIPSELGLLSQLLKLTLGQNTAINSTIPPELGVGMTSLRILHLQDLPSLHGTIPDELANLVESHNLAVINVNTSGSLLTGTLPESFCRLQKNCSYQLGPEVWLPSYPCSLILDCPSSTTASSPSNNTLCGCDCPCTVLA